MESFCANEFRSTRVCVDRYENGIMIGHLYNPAFVGAVRFESLMEFLLAMEDLLDQMNFPQQFNARRSFCKRDAATLPYDDITERRGNKATFIVKVLFRQNASWQGSVNWLDHKSEECFRSALELIFLLNSVLTQGRSEDQA